MTKTFVTSDSHFGHVNILKYCQRPFHTVEDMDQSMIDTWNKRVGPNDVVYHLGDFAYPDTKRTFDVLPALNGKIILVPGNHDDKDTLMAFDQLQMQGQDDIILRIDRVGHQFLLCHYPFESWPKGMIHLHGHQHGETRAVPNRFDVGVDVYGGPVELTADLRFLKNPEGWGGQGYERVFVFGSNRAGIHGAGAAKFARQHRGAVLGKGEGFYGNSYALPTKDENIETLPIAEVALHVSIFLDFARANPDKIFEVTRVGCGLAGFTDREISFLFKGYPPNCHLPRQWVYMLK